MCADHGSRPRTVLSQGSFLHLPTGKFVSAAAEAGFDAVTLWRHAPTFGDAGDAAAAARAAGIRVEAVCRGGYVTAAGKKETLRALADAAVLGASQMVVIAGPPSPGDPRAAAADLSRALEQVLPAAERAGIALALEPFHPMFAADRSWLVTLGQAVDIADAFDSPFLGITVDSYHLWWDPALATGLHRAGDRITGVQIADWTTPGGDVLPSRGMPGEGVIPLREFLRLVTTAGYTGPVEIEVLSDRFRALPPLDAARALKTALDRTTADVMEGSQA
ncbi:sugar phosphate isomerase [Streptomyces sulfonofaciens]|uniref:Sugar phosphate isomerase n=2 Tax=Streptomyces sulfonofaciens TaxID=68272 RepID=A0A919L8X8_9ACTN|nr:sugar phosphate isomerase [Streptomyces sulfonofaciens]